MDTRQVLIVCLTCIIVFGTFVTGCTITVNTQNQQYFDALNRCVQGGGSWIPSKGNNEGNCIMRNKGE